MQIEKFLKEGEIVKVDGDYFFKLQNLEENPLVKPKDFGFTWYYKKREVQGAIFNPGATIYQGKVILMPRTHKEYTKAIFFDENLQRRKKYFRNYISEVRVFESEDGLRFKMQDIVIKGDGSEHKDFTYGIEDLRITRWEDGYFLIGCGKVKYPFLYKDADRVAIYFTRDFKDIKYCGIISDFDCRNAVALFVNKKIYLFLRFFPNIYLAEIPDIDLLFNPQNYHRNWQYIWENKNKYLLLGAGNYPWDKKKIGAGPPAVLTPHGILFIYHQVGEIPSAIGKVWGIKRNIKKCYTINAALLDTENPRKIIAKSKFPIYVPSMPWETRGNKEYKVDVEWVIFPTGSLIFGDKLLIYAGAGDKYVVGLSCSVSKLVNYLLERWKI